MPKLAQELGALQVSRLRAKEGPGLHFIGGVAGLALQITPTGAQSWTLRARVGGRRREMGLGPYPEVPFVKARDKAHEARELIRQGVDPIDRQRAARSALRAATASALTFKQTTRAYIEAHEVGWRNAKHAQQWRNEEAGRAAARRQLSARVVTFPPRTWRPKMRAVSTRHGTHRGQP